MSVINCTLLIVLFNYTGVHSNTALQNVRGLLKKDEGVSQPQHASVGFYLSIRKKYVNIMQHYNSRFTVQQ
jgi:hypothetical protein